MSGVQDTTVEVETSPGAESDAGPPKIERIKPPEFAPAALNRSNGHQLMTADPGQPISSDLIRSATPSWAPHHDVDILREAAEAAVPQAEKPTLDIRAETRFVREQEWLGRVEDVAEEYFSTTLWDVTGETGEEEWAEISWQLVADQDVEQVRPGALFYWVIGFRISPQARRGESRLIFRRSLPWTPIELRRAHAEADAHADSLSSHPSP